MTKLPSPEERKRIHEAALISHKREARRGNPESFIRFQWEHLRCKTDEEYALFGRSIKLDDFQWDIVKHVFAPDHAECFIKGCTKPGKGFAVALAANIWYDVWDDARIVLTGPSFNQAWDVMFGEFSSLRQKMFMPGPGELQTRGMTDKTDRKHSLNISNPKSGEGFSGAHSPHVLFVFDEASAVDGFYYDNAKQQARFIIALSNPRTLSGWFRKGFWGAADPDKCQSMTTDFGRRRLVTVSGADCMNVRKKRLEKPFGPLGGIVIRDKTFEQGEPIPPDYYKDVKLVIPSQLDYAKFKAKMADDDPWKVNVFALGKFPSEDLDLQVILGSWLELAADVWPEFIDNPGPTTAFGLDPAASKDADHTGLAWGNDSGVKGIKKFQIEDAMTLCGEIIKFCEGDVDGPGVAITEGNHPIAIDWGGGYGRGVGDRLRELGVAVIQVMPNKRSKIDPERYMDTRTELFGELGRRLNPNSAWDNPWAIMPDQELHDDLCAQERVFMSDGVRFKLIPKNKRSSSAYKGKTVREKLGRSPDKGDAVALLYKALRSGTDTDVSGRSLIHALSDWEEEQEHHEPTLAELKSERIAELCQQMDSESGYEEMLF